jgi:hypothetical protein
LHAGVVERVTHVEAEMRQGVDQPTEGVGRQQWPRQRPSSDDGHHGQPVDQTTDVADQVLVVRPLDRDPAHPAGELLVERPRADLCPDPLVEAGNSEKEQGHPCHESASLTHFSRSVIVRAHDIRFF